MIGNQYKELTDLDRIVKLFKNAGESKRVVFAAYLQGMVDAEQCAVAEEIKKGE